ncbi:MAG: hypothetical protein C0458_18770 [Methylobacterium sp.]|nr:hypothetical protein [Methylobacterium sp.]
MPIKRHPETVVAKFIATMRELTFFTSNQTKLAHARYLAEGRRVRIKGFRQRTYHAGYVEPRLSSRDEILTGSYESAKAQLAKAGFSEASHPFILEDTSVRIEALSHDGVEVPGVDVKFWMEEQTFARLDAALRRAGNDRRAVVRSDVLLHVPSAFRRVWRVDQPFLIFTGEQQGSIVEAEHRFDANQLCPWLDNRSFNKWFVPDGHTLPFGALPIGDAYEVDFRRKSFGPLFDFFESRGFFDVPMTQLQLNFDDRPNIILSGYTCSGKTTASQRLARKFGYLHVEASDFMHLSYYYRHGYRDVSSIGDFAEQALTQMPTIAAEKVIEYMQDHISDPIVISGFRSPLEVELLRQAMKRHGRTSTERFVIANEEVRYARLQARARPGDNLTLDQFRERDCQQRRMGLDMISDLPDMLTIRNEGSVDAYLQQVDELAGGGSGLDLDIPKAISALDRVREVALQEAILIALLTVWENKESRKFYTTTDIAALISSVFRLIQPKHKDNVSRYFNQDFYAYYEISSTPNRGTRRYRLSNTGYGIAIKSLREVLNAANP